MADYEDPYIGSVDLWAGNFAPRGWSFCAGQLLAIAQWDVVFALIGTFYGGDGVQTFKLPDLRGRIPVGVGRSPGTSDYSLGEMAGTESMILTTNNLPIHNHTATGSFVPLAGTTETSPVNDPTDKYFSLTTGDDGKIYTPVANSIMGSTPATITLANNGNSQPISMVQPYLAVNYIFCMEGVFPSRN